MFPRLSHVSGQLLFPAVYYLYHWGFHGFRNIILRPAQYLVELVDLMHFKYSICPNNKVYN